MTLRELYNKLEDDNQHSLNAVLVAVAARDYKAVIRLAELLKEHLEVGELLPKAGKERHKLSKPLYRKLVKEGVL